MPRTVDDVARDILAAEETEAKEIVNESGYGFRVIVRDGHQCLGDYNPNRINVEVRDGFVVATTIG